MHPSAAACDSGFAREGASIFPPAARCCRVLARTGRDTSDEDERGYGFGFGHGSGYGYGYGFGYGFGFGDGDGSKAAILTRRWYEQAFHARVRVLW